MTLDELRKYVEEVENPEALLGGENETIKTAGDDDEVPNFVQFQH